MIFTKLNLSTAVTSGSGKVWAELSFQEQLSAPTLSISGGILTITDESGLATSFDILVDGKVVGTTTAETVDLSLFELEAGVYIIRAVAKAEGYLNSEASSPLECVLRQISAPTLSLSGNTLVITDNSGLATSFDILINGEVKGTVTGRTFDLSTLELAEDTYSITAIAKAGGYVNSEESEGVSYEVTAEDTLAGTWVFNDTLVATSGTPKASGNVLIAQMDFSFVSDEYIVNHSSFLKIERPTSSLYRVSYGGYGGYVNAWVASYFKTIAIQTRFEDLVIEGNCSTEPDIFLAWLQANATKQS